MGRSVRGYPISPKDNRRNGAISRMSPLVELSFGVIRCVFHSGHLIVTTHLRAHVKKLFACFSDNLITLLTIRNQLGQRQLFPKKEGYLQRINGACEGWIMVFFFNSASLFGNVVSYLRLYVPVCDVHHHFNLRFFLLIHHHDLSCSCC
jgi:hypothetical protein